MPSTVIAAYGAFTQLSSKDTKCFTCASKLESALVYSSQNAFHLIFRLYMGCRYPGAAADRPPSASAQHASRCCWAEPEPTLQRQEALPYLWNWENGAGGWEKHERLQRKAPYARIRRMRQKDEQEGKCGWAWPWESTPCRPLIDRRSFGIFYPCIHQATLPPLLPPSHTIAGADGDLGGYTSPLSSRHEKLHLCFKIRLFWPGADPILPQDIDRHAFRKTGQDPALNFYVAVEVCLLLWNYPGVRDLLRRDEAWKEGYG